MPPEVALLNNIKYEWLILIMVIYTVFKKPIDHFFGYIWCKITKKKTITWEQYVENESLERLKRQTELDNRFDRIQAEVNRIGTKVIDVREEIKMLNESLENYEQESNTMNKVNLENTLFNEAISPFRRLKAYLYLTAMGANGRIKIKGIELVLDYKETWLDVLDTTSENLNFGRPEDKEYYNSVLSEIDRRIFDMSSKPYPESLEKLYPAT